MGSRRRFLNKLLQLFLVCFIRLQMSVRLCVRSARRFYEVNDTTREGLDRLIAIAIADEQSWDFGLGMPSPKSQLCSSAMAMAMRRSNPSRVVSFTS